MRFLFRPLFPFIAPCGLATSIAGVSTAVVRFRGGRGNRVVDAMRAEDSKYRPDGPQPVPVAACAAADSPRAAVS